MRWVMFVLLMSCAVFAQEFEYELQPNAFPVEVNDWQLFQPWAGGLSTTTPELCDMDNDGDLDYFSGGTPYYIAYFKNVGSPSVALFQYATYQVDSLSPFMDVDFADMNAEGLKDAVLGGCCFFNLGSTNQFNFCGDPDTLFDTSGNQLLCPRTAVADIDADGDYDILAGQVNGTIRFYQNIGSSGDYIFQLNAIVWQAIQTTAGYTDPCFGDLDADGDLDLLVGTGAGTIYYYRNDGTAQNANMVLVSSNYLGLDVQEDASPELADIDGDGDLDLFVGRSPAEGPDATQGDIFFYRNEGNAQIPDFQYVTSNYLTWDSGRNTVPRLVDIDADGDADLFSRIGDRLTLYRNQGSQSAPLFVYETANFESLSVTDIQPWFCDLDADGDYDLLAGESSIPGPPGLHLYINRGTPQQPDYLLYSDDLVPGVFTTQAVVLIPWTADIDADGDLDLFVDAGGGRVHYFENIGSSTSFQFQFIINNWQNLGGVINGPFWGCFYDMDADGDLDFFMNSEAYYYQPWDKNLMFYRNVGTPQNAQMVIENEDLFPELMIWQAAPYLIDMDQDSDGDMFVGDTWGGIRYFKNVTGDTSAVGPPPVQRHPQAGLQISLGPNPANPITVIRCKMQVASEISLEVFDISGRKLVELASGFHLPGEYRYVWDAGDRAAGMYFVRLRAGEERMIGKVVMLK